MAPISYSHQGVPESTILPVCYELGPASITPKWKLSLKELMTENIEMGYHNAK
jgi:hypothetical protein